LITFLALLAGAPAADTQFERARRLCLEGGGVAGAAERASRAGWMQLPAAVAEAWGGPAMTAAGVKSRVRSDAERFSVLMVYADPADPDRHICALEESPGDGERVRAETRTALGVPPRRSRDDFDTYVVGQFPDGRVTTDLSEAGARRVIDAGGDFTTVLVSAATAQQRAQVGGRSIAATGRVSMIGFSQADRLNRP
jgi:hypothetical protein